LNNRERFERGNGAGMQVRLHSDEAAVWLVVWLVVCAMHDRVRVLKVK